MHSVAAESDRDEVVPAPNSHGLYAFGDPDAPVGGMCSGYGILKNALGLAEGRMEKRGGRSRNGAGPKSSQIIIQNHRN